MWLGSASVSARNRSDPSATPRKTRKICLRTAGAKDSFFLFKADGPVEPRGCGLSHFHFGFVIDGENYRLATNIIKRRGITVHHNPHRPPGEYVYIEDPDGYVVQLEPSDCG